MRDLICRTAAAAALAFAVIAIAGADARAVRSAGEPRLLAPRAYSAVIAFGSARNEYLVAYRAPDEDVIALQRVSRTGAPVGSPARMAAAPGTSVTALAYVPRRDEFVVAWRANTQPGSAGPVYAVYGRRIDGDGTPLGATRTLLGPEEQAKWRLDCCEEVQVIHNPRGTGSLLAWRARSPRSSIAPYATLVRELDGDLRPGAARRAHEPVGARSFAVTPDPSSRGYLAAAWIAKADGSNNALRTSLLTGDGRRRRGDVAVVRVRRGFGVSLAANTVSGGFAIQWSQRGAGIRTMTLDRSGRRRGSPNLVPPRGRYNDMTPGPLAFNPVARRYLHGWTGSYQEPVFPEGDEYFSQPVLRELAAADARPTGRSFLPQSPGPLASSTRERRWMLLSTDSAGGLYAQPLGPG
jgi:hypothetical protein